MKPRSPRCSLRVANRFFFRNLLFSVFYIHVPQIRVLNPFRTAIPFWGQTTQISSSGLLVAPDDAFEVLLTLYGVYHVVLLCVRVLAQKLMLGHQHTRHS